MPILLVVLSLYIVVCAMSQENFFLSGRSFVCPNTVHTYSNMCSAYESLTILVNHSAQILRIYRSPANYLRSGHGEHTVNYISNHTFQKNDLTVLQHTPSKLRNMTIAFTHMQIPQYELHNAEQTLLRSRRECVIRRSKLAAQSV